jgi:hypothetical protein
MLFTLGWPAWMDAGVVCEYHLVPMEDMAKVLFLMSQRPLIPPIDPISVRWAVPLSSITTPRRPSLGSNALSQTAILH